MTGIVREVREFLFVEKHGNLRRFFRLSDSGNHAVQYLGGAPGVSAQRSALGGFCRWRSREPSESLIKSPDTRMLTRAAFRQAG
jgi:hypothetical protein